MARPQCDTILYIKANVVCVCVCLSRQTAQGGAGPGGPGRRGGQLKVSKKN